MEKPQKQPRKISFLFFTFCITAGGGLLYILIDKYLPYTWNPNLPMFISPIVVLAVFICLYSFRYFRAVKIVPAIIWLLICGAVCAFLTLLYFLLQCGP